MNEDICRWIIEFILRSSVDDRLLRRVLAAIPIPDKDFRLKKTVLLRAIESEVAEAVITEKLLEIFEAIEQLDRTEGVAIMESMKAAYCAVAVESTVKFLAVGGTDKHGRYFDAVKKIWRVRVTELERLGESKLVSRELKAWKNEIEAAFGDKNVYKKLVKMNTRYEALKLIGDYLGEAWAVLGPPFIQLSASLAGKRATNEMQSVRLEDKTAAVSQDVGGNGGIELPPQTENCARPEPQSCRQVLSQVETERNDLLNVNQDLNTERLKEVATQTEEGLESVRKEVAVLHNQISVLPKAKFIVSHRRARGAKISHLEDLDLENASSAGKYTCLLTPEVDRVREALRTSCLELEAVVKDPLPDALRIAECVAHDLTEKNQTREHSLEDRNDAVASNPAINRDAAPIRSVNADLNNPCHRQQTSVPRPSIMERNSTACTYEWNDSIDDSLEGNNASRLHLPTTPKRKVISPLKKYEEVKIVRRRKSKKWSLLEEDTLRTAVEKYGKGNWKLILNSYRDIFDERTEVDLKDKWRNMTRY